MTSGELPCYLLVYVGNDVEFPTEQQLKNKFEKGDVKAKIEALKNLISTIQSGEKVSKMLMMYVIRFCLPTTNHYLKKLLLIFWEVVPKTSPDGKLLHEMILVCDAYRKDLQHPNEFIRGSTLRFLCKLREPELLEPLMPSIRKCLEHRHSYVRRNAILAIFTIYKNFEFLISDGLELIAQLLETEHDASCKRNAFMMLLHVDQSRALEYLSGRIDQVFTFGDILQLIIVELIYKVCYNNPTERGRFIRCVYNLLQSQSAAVRYEAAGTLAILSTAPTAIKSAASTYIDLIVKESDNNVKLIVLDRLTHLRESASSKKVLQELVMDILRVLSSTDYEVRKKILALALDLVSSRNVQEIIMYLKKEIDKTTNTTQEDVGRYRKLLVQTLHSTAIKFPDVAPQILPILMEFLSDKAEMAVTDVLIFVREAVQRMSYLRTAIIQQLLEVFPLIRNANVYRSAMWVVGEHADTAASIFKVFELVKQSIGELPIVDSEQRENYEEKSGIATQMSKTLVTADGTYATQSAFVSAASIAKAEKPLLRELLLDGNFFVGAALGNDLSKLVYRFAAQNSDKKSAINRLAGEACAIIASIIHLGKSGLSKTPITESDFDRLSTTLRAIVSQLPSISPIFLEKCRDALSVMLTAKGDVDRHEANGLIDNRSKIVQVDSTISFTQLLARPGIAGGAMAAENLFDLSLSQALGTVPKTTKFDFSASKLGTVLQLAGFSDPVYVEAYVNVKQYDVVLDVLVVNKTPNTLQNLSLELSTVGDLRLVDKPPPITLAPHDFTEIKATVKVASTENGVILSTITYDVRGSTSNRNCVYLDDICIDVTDYIEPGACTDTEFRAMWAAFEWENKVAVATSITDLRQYLEHISTHSNMRLLTNGPALDGECGFLAANLCARSIFGEKVLANISIEKSDPLNLDSLIIGHIRIRAKSQGMAQSVGDKIKSLQSAVSPEAARQ